MNIANNLGRTAFTIANSKRPKPRVSILLREGADVNIKLVPASNLSPKERDDQAKRNDPAKNKMCNDPLDEEESPIETEDYRATTETEDCRATTATEDYPGATATQDCPGTSVPTA